MGEHAVRRVMAVEDNRGDAILLRRALLRASPHVDLSVSASAEDALDELRGMLDEVWRLPHLILLDINLPGMSGLDLLLALKTDPRLRHLLVIMLSSSNQPVDVKRAYAQFANGYIRKPVDTGQYDHIARCMTECWLNMMELPADDLVAK